MYWVTVVGASPPTGFPIRKSPDLCLLSGSPELIAASHVLHRLLAPRHPPRALLSLTTFLFRGLRCLVGFSFTRGTEDEPSVCIPRISAYVLSLYSLFTERWGPSYDGPLFD